MNYRWFLGSILTVLTNSVVMRMPSRRLRRALLKLYLQKLSEGASVQMGCRFLNGRHIAIGRRSVINFGCTLDGRKYPIVIGDDVSIGPSATILSLGHDVQSPGFADRGGRVEIGDRVWIGYGAIVLPNVVIGTGAVVAAGSVVTKDVSEYTIVAGVPARQIGVRNRDLTYHLAYDPWLM